MIFKKRLAFWIYVFCFTCIFFIINATGTESKDLKLYVLDDKIIMPFPDEPNSTEPIEIDNVIYYAYFFSDQELGMSYSTTIIKDSRRDNLPANMHVSIFLQGHAKHQQSEILKKGELEVEGRAAGYITTHRERRSLIIRSNIIAIYDEGNIYTWDVQGVPELVGDMVDNVFFENIESISFLE